MKKLKQVLLVLLLIDSLAVFGIWVMNLTGGAFPNGVFVGQEEISLPILHLIAEFLMAATTLVGVIGIWRRKPWAKGITLLGLGMFTYSAINSMGWAILNDPVQAIPMVVTILVVLAAVPVLIESKKKNNLGGMEGKNQ